MRRLAVGALMLMALAMCGGCYDKAELRELAIVAAIGIDLADEEGFYEVTAQLVRPGEVGVTATGAGGMGRPFAVVSAKDKTVFGAIRKATTVSSRKLFFSHIRTVVLGRKLAESGINSTVDFLIRDEELRPTLKVVVATGEARDTIYSVTEFESVPGLGLDALLEGSFVTSSFVNTTLHEFRQKLILQSAFQPVVPLVDSVTAATIGSDISPSGSSPSPTNQEKEKVLRIEGSAVLKGERLAGFLSLDETRGYRWIQGDVQSGIITVAALQDKKKIDIEILNASSSLDVEISPAGPVIKVEVFTNARIGAKESSDDVSSPEMLHSLEGEYNQAITQEMLLALSKARELNTDFLGFGDLLRTKRPEIWRDLKDEWDNVFPQLEVKISVDSNIRRFGLIGKPVPPR